MTINLPLVVVLLVLGYFGMKLHRVPPWIVVVLVLGGFWLSSTFLAAPIESGTHTGVSVVNGK